MTGISVRDRIVDAALDLAERRSWEALRLHDVAVELDISLDDVRRHFREKEELVDAWFDRADTAMLGVAAKPDVAALPPRSRIHRLLMAWFAALAAHKRVTRQMLLNKLEPGHIHYQITGLLRISRTVQWWREAANRDAVLPRRAIEEAVLTGIYLTTFGRWMMDDADNTGPTAALLDNLLAGAERLERGPIFGRTLP